MPRLRFKEFVGLEAIDEVFVVRTDGGTVEVLREGKWLKGRFDRNLRIDHPTHGAGQTHAHVLGRKGQQIGVVNLDGTGSHGTKMRLHPKDAEALRTQGFTIPNSNI